MTKFSYHASHEQFAPSKLLDLVILAEKAGFNGISSSDHFHPWSKRQGQSGFAFAWLGAAMQATQIPFSLVNAPGQRYHPAIVAQAIATLCEMFPQRFNVALGSGEALNERITGEKWPAKDKRNDRLLECFQIIKKLLAGQAVSHYGLVNVEEAKLYTIPTHQPLLLAAAVTKETAEWVGSWADGLLTVSRPHEELKEVIHAFYKGGGKGKPLCLKVQLSYDISDQEALDGAYDQWRTNVFQGSVLSDLWKVEHYDALGELVKKEDLNKMIRISSNMDEHIQWLKKDMELGFEKIILHNVNLKQEKFIHDFGNNVLPILKNL